MSVKLKEGKLTEIHEEGVLLLEEPGTLLTVRKLRDTLYITLECQ